MKSVVNSSSTSTVERGPRCRKAKLSVPDKELGGIYATIRAIFKQYDKIASIITSYNTIEEVIFPYIVLDMNIFQLKVPTERDVWTHPQNSSLWTRVRTAQIRILYSLNLLCLSWTLCRRPKMMSAGLWPSPSWTTLEGAKMCR
jgi:hypothetical protein